MGAPWMEVPDLDVTAVTTSRFHCTSAKIPPIMPGILDLKDYSGPLQRQLSPLDFSKDMLVALVTEAARFYFGLVDAFWNTRVKENWGDKIAYEREDRVWEMNLKYNVLYLEEALDLGQSTPVEKAIKVWQMNPGVGLLIPVEIELIAPNVGIMTCWNCKSIDFFLGRGEEMRLCDFCWRMEQPLIQLMGQFFDSSMRCMPLRLLSPSAMRCRKGSEGERRKANEPDCQWMYWVGDIKAGDRAGYVAARKKEAEVEGIPTDLKNYRGPVHARLGMSNFCKDTVAKVLIQVSRLIRIQDGQWRTVVTEKYGVEPAWERLEKAWGDVIPLICRFIPKAMNSRGGNPIEQCLKALQINPMFGLMNNCTFDLESPDVGIVSVYRCTTRDYFERQGGMVDLSHICGETEQQLFQKYAQIFDPNIKVKPRKVPNSRQRADPGSLMGLTERIDPKKEVTPVCQWEFRLSK
jgi:hypothetical protein